MKICSSCKQELSLDNFNKKGSEKYQPYCRPCDNQRARSYYENNKDHHKAVIRKRTIKYRDESRKWIRELKESKPCLDCGVTYPWYVMDFDHVSGEKDGNVSAMIARKVSKQKILDEIAKCELVCANCHRARTFSRLGF